MPNKLISVVVPVYNEERNLKKLLKELNGVLKKLDNDYEVIFVDDGSSDNSPEILRQMAEKFDFIRFLIFSRNFGKEIALTAGVHAAKGDAILMMDSDLQHPPRYIPEFIDRWEAGKQVIIGVRDDDGEASILKLAGSKFFNWMMNKVGDVPFVPGATDFRLIDRRVADEFARFTERSRITRGLIDWLGFEREYIAFKADERNAGSRSYSYMALVRLARDSMVSLSLVPLRVSGYLGVFIVTTTGPLGLYMITDKYFLSDRFDFTSTAALSVLLMFMVGVVLINLGLISLYIATIHREVGNRPLYVIKHGQD